MSARDSIRALFGALDEVSTAELDRRLGAHRTEVLNEAAGFVGNDDTCDCGGCTTCYGRHLAAGLLAMAGEKATATTAVATPEFFQPGRTYAHGDYRFICEYLATHPTSGRRSAWGWFGKNGAWRHHSFSERQFQAREWTDVTEAGGDRG